MSRVIVLDTSVLGVVIHPHDTPSSVECRAWLEAHLAAQDVVMLPEIADYELRRELLRRNVWNALRRLDALQHSVNYQPLTTEVMRKAATLWAQARQGGQKTAADPALDGDMILTAQALLFAQPGDDLVIATTNVKHLTLFAPARPWQEI